MNPLVSSRGGGGSLPAVESDAGDRSRLGGERTAVPDEPPAELMREMPAFEHKLAAGLRKLHEEVS